MPCHDCPVSLRAADRRANRRLLTCVVLLTTFALLAILAITAAAARPLPLAQ